MAYIHNGVCPPPPPLPLHLQPENLLLASKTKGASVKLADFGLAVEAMDGKHYYGENCVATSSLSPSLPPTHSLSLCLPSFGKDSALLLVSITFNLEALVDKCMCIYIRIIIIVMVGLFPSHSVSLGVGSGKLLVGFACAWPGVCIISGRLCL